MQTDCASTTSTSGSMMATRRMVLMSNPYTRSHPEQGRGREEEGRGREEEGRGREEEGRGREEEGQGREREA